MKIAVIGSGYVGLVSGICFAEIGFEVSCIDVDANKINLLNQGSIPIYEPGLKALLARAVKNKKISFTTNLSEGLSKSAIILIAVGTPQNENNGNIDLSYIYSAAKDIALNISDQECHKIIVTKSTVTVGTGQQIKRIIKEVNPSAKFSVVSNPEFLREGSAIEDFMNPDRIVVGTEDIIAKEAMTMLYSSFLAKQIPVIFTDIATAELIKYAANSFLATKVAFINEMADLCEKINGNIKDLSLATGLDSRIGSKFLNPGPGFGGSCFPKDILALSHIAKENNSQLAIVDAVISSNNNRKTRMAEKIVSVCEGSVTDKTITILGLAFKANTDDIRYSPAIVIAKELLKKGAKLRLYDQEAVANTKKELGENSQISYFSDPYEAAQSSHALIIATEWKEFHNLDLKVLKNNLSDPLIVDLRNMLNPEKVRSLGFRYFFIGGK